MTLGFLTEEVREGKARLLVPALDASSGEPEQHLRSMAPVFYNPVMKTNRDTAVLALAAHQRILGREVTACEPMSGSGVRGIRLALEVKGIERVVMGDLSPSAVRLGGYNTQLNNVQVLTEFRLLDANLLLSLHCYPGGRFDYVDVDPYGTPTPFIDTAVRAVKNHGVLALTATDMAPLCGVNPRACIRKYGGAPLNGEFCHEAALRLLIGSLVRQAAVHERAATLLFSYYADHYIRVYSRLDKGKQRADSLLGQMGYIKHCAACLHRWASDDNRQEDCPECGGKTNVGGPLWLGELCEPVFVSGMLAVATGEDHLRETRAVSLINRVRGEHGYPPWFFDIDALCSSLGRKSMATQEALNRVTDAGFRVAKTHFSERGLKTDASASELREALGG
ncbi:tRNA (guanine(10)-N(2))-dimethyltransferase [Candidatus Bathyarchaeota archaeon]|nr:tRNA (guanine(10)-N(2))-dimethyltransferase [Candidatus Bathyarchaeota archaeon]